MKNLGWHDANIGSVLKMFITPAALRRTFILKALRVSNSKVLVFLKFKGAPVE